MKNVIQFFLSKKVIKMKQNQIKSVRERKNVVKSFRITETQNKIDELARKCKQRAEQGYGYYSDEFPDISIDYIYDIKKVFQDAGFVFNEHIEHWWTIPDQVRGIYIEWKKDDFYKKLGK